LPIGETPSAPSNVTATAASARLEYPLRQRLAAAASEPIGSSQLLHTINK
jgi:hypothetical protein